MNLPIYFLHGLHGTPGGVKATFLQEKLPDVRIPALSQNIHERLAFLEKEIQAPSILIGSSLGGLSALLFAAKHPELVKGMVLVAPAVDFYDPAICSEKDRPLVDSAHISGGLLCKVMAGRSDKVIPLEAIQKLVNEAVTPERVELHICEDDHGMNSSLDLLWQLTQEIINSCE